MRNPPSRARPSPRTARSSTNGRTGGTDGVPTLKRVHAAARARFAERGYGAASMRQIAADAGITIGTLFFHSSTKEQLLFDALMDSLEELSHGLRSKIDSAGTSWSERLAAAFAYHIEFSAEQAFGTTISKIDMLHLNAEHRAQYIALRAAYEREFRDLIRWGIAAKEFRPVDPRLASFALLGIGQTVGRWYRPDGPMTPNEIAAQYIDLIFNGLCLPSLEPPPDALRLQAVRRQTGN
jgi:AcrR family transcriptional regulator